MKSWEGQTMMVTGGMGAIGTAICREFSAKGVKVTAVDIVSKDKAADWQQAQAELGFQIDYLEANVSDPESCLKAVEAMYAKQGRVDILINNAGITRDAQLAKMDLNDWQAVLRTNLDSVFNMSKPAITHMIENGYGRVINISSVNGLRGQFGQTNYASSKAGILGFTKSLALEVANKGITVNSISPGYVKTPLTDAIRADIIEKIVKQIPVGRFATPDEIAWAALFLADPRSAFVTGANLSINGGYYMSN